MTVTNIQPSVKSSTVTFTYWLNTYNNNLFIVCGADVLKYTPGDEVSHPALYAKMFPHFQPWGLVAREFRDDGTPLNENWKQISEDEAILELL